MRLTVCVLSAALAVGACSKAEGEKPAAPGAGAPNPVAALAGPPKPQPGLWESTMTMQSPAPMKVSTQVCIDQAMVSGDDWMKTNSDRADMPDCQQAVTPAPGGYMMKSTCKFQGRTIVTEAKASGNFRDTYVMEIASRTDPAPAGIKADGKMTVAMKRLGPCAPGQAAGPVAGSVKMQPG